MYKQVAFSREELYQMVWARPVLTIAKEIGVSDVALAWACRRTGIPLPGRGYWAATPSGARARFLSRPLNLDRKRPLVRRDRWVYQAPSALPDELIGITQLLIWS